MSRETFYVEDSCALKSDPSIIGIVDRTSGDVDTHETDPARDYSIKIEAHKDVPDSQFSEFLKSGIPHRGIVLVAWQNQTKVELIPETELDLLDRSLLFGDVVKRDPRSAMSGTVTKADSWCTLGPMLLWTDLPPTTIKPLYAPINKARMLYNVPATELKQTREYSIGDAVVYLRWIGRVEECTDEITLRLSNNSIVVLEDATDIDLDGGEPRPTIGDVIRTKKGNLRRGLWKFGAYDPRVEPAGVVVDVRSIMISVQWLCQKPWSSQERRTEAPPQDLDIDILDSGNVHVYDKSRTPHAKAANAGFDVVVGKRVRFKDLSGACVKYDGSKSGSDHGPHGLLTKIPRTETLGYDANVFSIVSTTTEVTVQWQDLTVTKHRSTELVPDVNVEDEDEVWPGEVVCTKENKSSTDSSNDPPRTDWMFHPARVGAVQSVKAADRIAKVRWMPRGDVRFTASLLLPQSFTGPADGPEEEVSLYDITSHPGLNRRRGDIVLLLHPPHQNWPFNAGVRASTGADFTPGIQDGDDAWHAESFRGNWDRGQLDWIGEIIDLRLDGQLLVRLGALQYDVVDVIIRAESVFVALGSEADFSEEGGSDSYDDDMSLDEDMSESEDDMHEYDVDTYNDTWYETSGVEGSYAVARNEDGAWSTEDEDDEDEDDEDDDSEDTDANLDKTEDTAMTDAKQSENEVMKPESSSPSQSPTNHALCPKFPSFSILETEVPADHHFLNAEGSLSISGIRRAHREHNILNNSLPDGVFVRTWESRLNLLRVVIIGPVDTPYEFAPFMIDMFLPALFPITPPDTYFHSWTGGSGAINPNLYEDGKICLSLLGTWPADETNETWSGAKSTLLQVIVSLLGLVLVKEPYYNEAGYETRQGSEIARLPSALYTERTYFRARAFIIHALTHPVAGLEAELHWLYLDQADDAPKLLDRAIEAARDILAKSKKSGEDEMLQDEEPRDGLRRVSVGAAIQLRRQLDKMLALRDKR